jgi:Uma2 family endonuclease
MNAIAATQETELVLGPELAGTLMTPEEFDSVKEWDELFVYELIHGVLIVSPPPSEAERGPNEALACLLWQYHDQHPAGSALDFTLHEHMVRTRDNRRRADRVIWAGLGRVPDTRRDVPTIVVEFVSAGRRNRHRDYVAKRQEYLEIGVREYWILDRFRKQLTVVRDDPTGSRELVVAANDVYTTPLLPGFELLAAKLFARAEMLEQARKRSD